MKNEPVTGPAGGKRFLGSLRDALVAASREDVKTEDTRQLEARAQSNAATKASADDDTQRLAPAVEPLALAAPQSSEQISPQISPQISAENAAEPAPANSPAAIADPPAIAAALAQVAVQPDPEAGQVSDAPTTDTPDPPAVSQPSEPAAQSSASQPPTSEELVMTTAPHSESRAPVNAAPANDAAAQLTSAAAAVDVASDVTMRQSAADAARQARGQVRTRAEEQHIEMEDPTTKLSRAGARRDDKQGGHGGKDDADAPPRTQLVRGKAKVGREAFDKDPVVGWLVVVGGPGLGAFRPIFEGNNTVGRASSQRVPIDFGDEAISSEEQAYIRYDSMDRSFLFVPNLAKTNVVQVNHQKPTSAVPLSGMDVITMGRTQLVFVPFCSADFDWSELSDLKE